MDDDFNTADALSAVFDLVKFANSSIGEADEVKAKAALDMLDELCDILGIKTKRETVVLDEEIEELIAQRQAARKEKNFARADEIRDELLKKGIILEDTREGVKWKRA